MRYRLVILLIILLNPLVVNAKNNSDYISFECKSEKDKTICEVWGNTKIKTKGIDFKFSLPTHIKNYSFTLVEDTYGSTDNNWLSVVFPRVLTDKFKIGSLEVTSKKNVSAKDIKVSDLTIVDENYEEHHIENSQNPNILIYIIMLIVFIAIIIVIIIIIKRGVFKI